jgi:hypothetical protein
VLQGELNWLRERKATLALELLKGEVSAIADAIRQIEAREAELASKIDESNETAVMPRADRWRTMHSLIDLCEQAPAEEREDIRLRLRAALRRNVESIWILVVPHGRDRLCAAQVWFADNLRQRSYLIFSKAGWSNGRERREGQWWARSFADAGLGASDLDFRDRGHAQRLADALTAADLSFLDFMK